MPLAQVEFYLSGGAANADPNLSLGGAVSATRLKSQTITPQSSNITGLTFDDAVGAEGIGTLKYINATNSLRWTELGAVENSLNDVDITGDGRHEVRGVAEFSGIFIDVVNASLPAIDAQDDLDVVDIANNLFPDVTEEQALVGFDSYRLIYITSLATVQILPSFFFNASAGYLSVLVLGFLPVEPALVTDDSIMPEGLDYQPFSNISNLIIPVNLYVGESAAIWIKRSIPASTPYELLNKTAIEVS